MKPIEKAGEWKGGVWQPKINNPKGYNRHNKNPCPNVEPQNQIETFAGLPDEEQKEIISKLGNRLYMMTKEIRPLMLRFKKYKDYYEKKHFGWGWEE